MIPVGILTAAATSSFSFLLDQFPGASHAYSLRKLRSAYVGNCIQVVRSSDNAVLNIGFVNNELDTTTLLTFVGANNGFISIWYDQSGNSRNGTSASGGRPQIVFSGSLLYRGSKVCFTAAPSQQFTLATVVNFLSSNNYSWFFTYEKNSAGNQPILTDGAGRYLWMDYGAQYYNNSQATTISTPYLLNTRYLVNNNCQSTAVTLYSNNVLIGSAITIDTAGFKDFPLGAIRSATLTMQEFILYSNSQLANRAGINTNINSFYLIY